MTRAWDDLRVKDTLWTWWSDPCAPLPRRLPPDASAVRLWHSDGLEIGLAILPCSLGGSITMAVVDGGDLTALGGGPGIGRDGQCTAVARALWQLVIARALDDPGNALHGGGEGELRGFGDGMPLHGDGGGESDDGELRRAGVPGLWPRTAAIGATWSRPVSGGATSWPRSHIFSSSSIP